MTWTPCLACGAAKGAALVACRSCGVQPADVTDRARHLVAAELPEAAREALATSVVAGEGAALDPADVSAMEAALTDATGPRVAAFALAVLGAPVLAIVAGLALLAAGLLSL